MRRSVRLEGQVVTPGASEVTAQSEPAVCFGVCVGDASIGHWPGLELEEAARVQRQAFGGVSAQRAGERGSVGEEFIVELVHRQE